MKSCNECPFSKSNVLDKDKRLGGATPTTYIGQAQGPFILPCHMDKNYNGKQTDYTITNQCRGAAQFRANIEVDHKMPNGILTLPKSNEVFESKEEFLAYYLDTSLELVRSVLTEKDYIKMMIKEFEDVNVKKINLK